VFFDQTSAPTAAPVAAQTFGLGCPEGKVFDDVLGCVGELLLKRFQHIFFR
jgi:hypothetical protein